jgi:hypothetical protein
VLNGSKHFGLCQVGGCLEHHGDEQPAWLGSFEQGGKLTCLGRCGTRMTTAASSATPSSHGSHRTVTARRVRS